MSLKYKEFLSIATPEQRTIIENIVTLFHQELTLWDKINAAMGAVKSGAGAFSEDGYSLTLCEDEGDFLVVTAGPRNELKRVIYQMALYLKEAVNTGMEDLDIIQKSFEHYVGQPLSEYKEASKLLE